MTTPRPAAPPLPRTPRTEAGRDLLAAFPRIAELEYGRNGQPIVAAIEAEAARSERERVRLAVEGLRGKPYSPSLVDRKMVLALLDPTP